MPTVSNRSGQTPSSPIRRLVPYAEAAKERGVKIYHLNIGQPDIRTPKIGIDALKNADMEVVAYTHSAGMQSYRDKLVESYKQYNIDVDADEIIVTNGGSEALLFTMLACLDSGDSIIVPEPFYANYNGFAKSLGVNIQPITASIENGFALPPIEAFEKAVTPQTKAILICNPSNPTGYLYSKEELEQLRTIVQKHDLYLIVDEVYRDFCYDGNTPISVLSIEGLEQHAIVVDSISKKYSACGARGGLLMSHNKELMAAAMKFAQARLSPSTFSQILGEAMLDTPQSYFDEVMSEYDSRRKLVVNRLNKIPGVVCPTPKGAFYAFVKLPIDDTDKFCQWLLESFNHNGETVMLAPGSGFYATGGLGTQEARLAYVLKEEDLAKAIDCLEAALAVYPGRVQTVSAEVAS
ncbi:MAG: pyridoxal phosphate-dependent aminotransferase [Aureispira sp.]|nr:pyridoxal phosphate-dependent aminotransferase [Aureispira sp.]